MLALHSTSISIPPSSHILYICSTASDRKQPSVSILEIPHMKPFFLSILLLNSAVIHVYVLSQWSSSYALCSINLFLLLYFVQNESCCGLPLSRGGQRLRMSQLKSEYSFFKKPLLQCHQHYSLQTLPKKQRWLFKLVITVIQKLLHRITQTPSLLQSL